MLIAMVDPGYMPSLLSPGIGIKTVIGCTLNPPQKSMMWNYLILKTSNSSAYRSVILNLVTEI